MWQAIWEFIEFIFTNKNDTVDVILPSMTQNAPASDPNAQTTETTPFNPDTLTSDWATPQGVYHNVRVLCDLAGLSVDEKNTLCACIYQESEFYNYLPSGQPTKHENLFASGAVASTDWGVCQINDYYHIGVSKDFASVQYVLQNPMMVVNWMIGMYKDGLLSQWNSYKTGAYRQWLLPTSPMWSLKQ